MTKAVEIAERMREKYANTEFALNTFLSNPGANVAQPVIRVNINAPIWKSNSVGIDENRINPRGYLEVHIIYKDRNGDRPFPNAYRIHGVKALEYPVHDWKGHRLHIIPIEAMEVLP